jgi:2-aminobenzoate-CoA ligase
MKVPVDTTARQWGASEWRGDAMSKRSDTFVKENLPPEDLLPSFCDVPGQAYPDKLNACSVLVDRWVKSGLGERVALRSLTESQTYSELLRRVSRYAQVLRKDLGLVPGNRVLLRGRNSPTLVAWHLAVWRAGGIVVSTMPLLRSGELAGIVTKAKISHAICESGLFEELRKCQRQCTSLRYIGIYNHTSASSYEGTYDVDALAEGKSGASQAYASRANDPCLIAFTSGTTGVPKGAVHTHRDLLAVCDTFSAHVIRPTREDIFCGTPPLAFTYGLGGLLLFPLRIGAASILIESTQVSDLLTAVARFKATVCFTVPTAYRAMLEHVHSFDVSSLRVCVSAGESLPRAHFDAFERETGLRLVDGIGSTEILHIFISAAGDDIRPGSTGKVVPGYEAAILDDEGNKLPPGVTGWLAVRGPTGCRYLDDPRQHDYVRSGWNITGDAYYRDADGYFWYQSRMDDLIVSAGYKIAPPEVESAVLSHPAVAECAVVGRPDDARGHIPVAFVVLRPGVLSTPRLTKSIQDHVKSEIAPYKYPRRIEFVSALPKTLTGKLKRYELRLRSEKSRALTSRGRPTLYEEPVS